MVFPACRLCGDEFTGRGHPPDATVHYDCEISAGYALTRLGQCMRDLAILEMAYALGYDRGEHDADCCRQGVDPLPGRP